MTTTARKRPVLTLLALGFALSTAFAAPAPAPSDRPADRWDLS